MDIDGYCNQLKCLFLGMPTPIEDYVQQNLPAAQDVQKKYGIPVQVTLAQGGIESGWGKQVVGGNLFGIKGSGTKTTDAQTGEPIEQRAYNSAEQSHDDYGKFLTENSRYKPAFAYTNDPKKFAAEVAKAGYSEKPEEYAKALDQTIDSIDSVLENHKPTTSGKIVVSPMQRQSLIDRGVDPDEYQAKINKDIDKGGESYDKAYRSYTLLNDASQTPIDKAKNEFNYKISGVPTNQFIDNYGNTFMKSWVNGWQRAVNGLKTAGEQALVATGLEDKGTFEQQIQDNLKDLSKSSLTLSPDANKDALNNPRAFIASVGNMTGTMVPLVAANIIGSGVSLFSGQPEIEAGVLGASLAIDPVVAATSAVVGGLQFTGEAYNTAREKGLNHEQAMTYSMIVGPAVGALGAFPVGELAGGLWKAARGGIADNAIETILDGNLSTAAFRDAQAETTSSVAQFLAAHAKNFGRVAAKDAVAGAAFNTIQGGMNDLADHLYGVGDPNKDEAKELFKDALQGAMFGTLFAAPAFMHAASNESLYGFIDRNQAKPEKLAAIKEYANKIAETKGSTPEQVQQMNGVIDEMHTVATKYGATIKDPDARYQIWQFGKESQGVAADSEVVDHKLQELDGLNPTVTASDRATYEEIKALNGQKEQLINDQLTKIGSSKKPVNYAEYEASKKAIQAQIDAKIKSLEPQENGKSEPDTTDVSNPVLQDGEKKPTSETKQAEGEQKPEYENDLDKVFGTGKPVAPKTVKDVLDVPISMGGTKGFLSMREDGGIDFTTTDKVKVYNVANKDKAAETLAKPFDAIGIQPEDVDQFQLRNKMDAEKAAELSAKEPVTEGEKAFAEFLDNPIKEEPDGTAVSTESERIATEEPETAKDFERLDKAVEDGAAVRKGKGKKGAKRQVRAGGGADSENVTGSEQSTPTQATEGAETTATEGNKNEADNKGAESEQPVKEDNGNEVEPTVITIKSEDSKRTVEVKMKAKAKEATAEAKEKGISLKEQKGDLVNKMQTAVSVIGDAEEITPEIEKELEGHGIRIIKSDERIKDLEERKGRIQKQMDAANEVLQEAKDNYAKKYKKSMKWETEWGLKYPISKAEGEIKQYQERLDAIDTQIGHEKAGRVTDQLGFHIKGDGDVRAGIENLKETLEMTKKEFPEKEGGETKVKYEKGKSITGPRKLTEGDALHGTTPREQYEIAKENYETAKTGGDKKFTEVLKRAFDSAKHDFDYYEKEGMLDKNWSEIREAEGKSFQKQGGKPIEPATVKLIDNTLKKAFPNIKTSFLSGEEFDAKHGEGAGIGVTNPDGTVDINTDKVTAQTQVHEMGHVWSSWAKKFAPALYERGMELASKETGIHEAIKADGYDLEGHALHEETLARMIGEEGEKLVTDLKEPTTLSEKAKAWVGEMWDKLKGYVKNRLGIKDNRLENLKDMPFNQFTAQIARELVSGKEISPISSEEVAGIESDGVSAYGIGDSKRYMKVFETTPGSKSIPISDIKIDEDPEKPLSAKEKNEKRIEGRIITNVSETGSTVSDNVAKDIADTNNFTGFQSKYLGLASKNKWVKNAYLKAQKAMLSISSPGTWAYSIAGKDGMFWKAYEALNTGEALAFRYKDDNLKLIKPLFDIANEGREKTLEHTKGDSLKALFPTAPDVKIAHHEQVELYSTLTDADMQEWLNNGESITLMLDDNYPDERKATEFTVTKADYDKLKSHFTPEQIKIIEDANKATGDATYKQEDPVFFALNGEHLNQVDNYHSRLDVSRDKDKIEDFKLKNTYVENVAAHKERNPSDKAVYLIQDPERAWERRLDQGAKFAGMAVPIRNTDVLMGYARQNMVDLEMEHYIKYWNKKKQVMTNPDPPVSELERFLVNNFSTATIGLNPLVDLKHLTTFPLASGYVPLKYTMASLGDVAESYVSLVKNLDPLNTGKPKNYTPLLQECLKDNYFFLRYKSGVDESQIRLKGDKFSVPMYKEGRWQMVDFADKASAMVFLKTLETATGTGLWSGAKKKVRAEMPHLTEGTPEFTEQVSKLYRDGITASQPSFNSVNRPLYMDGAFDKTRGVLNKTVSMFAGQPFAAFNETIKRGMGMLADPTPKTRFNFAKSLTNTLIVNALIVSGINLVRQKTIGSDKDKETLAGGTLRAALGSLPVIGPPLEIVYGKVERGAQGYDLNYPATEVVNDMAKTIAHAITGKESQAAKESMRIVPQLLGIPATPFKFGKAAYDVAQ